MALKRIGSISDHFIFKSRDIIITGIGEEVNRLSNGNKRLSNGKKIGGKNCLLYF